MKCVIQIWIRQSWILIIFLIKLPADTYLVYCQFFQFLSIFTDFVFNKISNIFYTIRTLSISVDFN